ncbi:MAG: RND family transporter [Spirochaetaceae bacterium]|nr:MAG: RND family transporter [Spirochaetaceae bacterium]
MRNLFRRPGIIVAVTAALTVFFALQIPGITINNNVEVFIPPHSAEKLAYDRMLDTYGSQQLVSVALVVERGSVLDARWLKLIGLLGGEIEALPFVNSVTSLVNADYIAASGGGMEVTTLHSDTGNPVADAAELRRRLFDWAPMYRGNLVSDDLQATQIIVTLEARTTTEEREQFVHRLDALLEQHTGPGHFFAVGGEPVVTVELKRSMIGDLTYLIPMVLIVVVVVLALAFRSVLGVVLPLLTVSVATVWAVGIMAMLGIYFSMISTVIPVLLVAVGSAYAIHLYSHYRELDRESSDPADPIQRREWVFGSMSRVGTPIALTALTTAAGFASIATSEIAPMRHFGFINAIGVLVALGVTLLLVPALLLILPQRTGESKRHDALPGRMERMLLMFHRSVGRRPAVVVAGVLLVAAACTWALTQVVVDNAMVEYFDRDSPVRTADTVIRERFSGTKMFSVLFEGDERGALTDPDALAAMDDLARYLERHHAEVGHVLSFSDFVRRMNRVMHAPDDEPDAGQPDAATPSDGNDGFLSFFGDEDDAAATHLTDAPRDEEARAPSALTEAALDPAGVADALNRALARAERLDISGAELVRLFNRELNIGGAAFDEIPLDPQRYRLATRDELRNLISQYLLIYSGGLSEFADDALEPQGARMLVQLRSTSTADTTRISRDALAWTERHLPDGYTASIAGFADIEAAVTRLIVRSQLTSIVTAMFIVFLIVAIAHRSAMAGLFGLVPLSVAVLINFGVMGIMGIHLNIATAMIASISIGIGVDYTIHVLAAYRRERAQSSDLDLVTERALLGTGKAIVFNAGSVAAGFLVLLLSNFNPLRYVGLLVAVTMVTSCIAAVTLLPALLNLFKPAFLSAEGGTQ